MLVCDHIESSLAMKIGVVFLVDVCCMQQECPHGVEPPSQVFHNINIQILTASEYLSLQQYHFCGPVEM